MTIVMYPVARRAVYAASSITQESDVLCPYIRSKKGRHHDQPPATSPEQRHEVFT
jgi:hypothetical protein